jgi:hypothetical protein
LSDGVFSKSKADEQNPYFHKSSLCRHHLHKLCCFLKCCNQNKTQFANACVRADKKNPVSASPPGNACSFSKKFLHSKKIQAQL